MTEISQEIIHKEIDLIQSCISRMAHNSFLIKGWAISLIAVVLAISNDTQNLTALSLILTIPLLSFWYLDAFFLQTERMYRKMYTWVLKNRKEGNTEYLYDLNPHRFIKEVGTIPVVMFSLTLSMFYGIPFFIIIAILTLQFCK